SESSIFTLQDQDLHLSTKILRNASTVSTIVPFKAYLKRRGIQRSISDCVAA
ncbi:Hypothetical protein FKW44_001241, partial [Caligus rogercresseyi]